MIDLPWFITDHARVRYAERTSPHLLVCSKGCPSCAVARDEVARIFRHHSQDTEIRRRLRDAELIDDYSVDYHGAVKEVVILEHDGMRFVASIEEQRNVLVTCYPPGEQRLRAETMEVRAWIDSWTNHRSKHGRRARIERRRKLEQIADWE